MGVMNVHPQTAAYRALNNCFEIQLELKPCPCLPAGRQCRARRLWRWSTIILSATLAQTFNNRSSRIVPIFIGRYRQLSCPKSRHRKIYINLKQIVHSLNLRSPLFRLVPIAIGSKCGNYCPSPRRTFHSSRRSGGFIRCCLLFFKGTHGLVVPPRHGSFLLQKKD